MKSILITGGAGFIGSHTAIRLVQLGHKVRILDNLDPQIHGFEMKWPNHLPTDCELILGSVTDGHKLREALDGIDTIYHFAAHTGVGQSMYEIEKYYQTNIMGTAVLVDCIIKNKLPIQQIILASSRAVYGEGLSFCPAHGVFSPAPRSKRALEKGSFEPLCNVCKARTYSQPTHEFSELKPTSYYGLTKLAQEQILNQVDNMHPMQITILRYFNVYGSFQSLINPYTGIISIFYSKLKQNSSIQLYENGLPVRNFVHIEDVVQANLKALSFTPLKKLILNIGSTQNTSLVEFIEIYKSLMKSQSPIEISDYFRLGDIYACVPELSLSQNLIDYKPKIKLHEGLLEFINWARFQKYQTPELEPQIKIV